METTTSDGKAAQTQPTVDLLVVCVLFTVALVFGMRAIGQAFPKQWAEPVSWYVVPVLFLVGGVLLAKITGVWHNIHLLGAGLNWRNAIVFSALALLIPTISNLLVLLGIRIFLPHLLGQATGGAVSAGHVIRSLVGSPIGEEVLLRGWLLAWLCTRTKTEYRVLGCTLTTANLLTSLTFTGMHLVNGINVFTPINLLSIFPLALLLGRARERTGGLLLPMICHSLINFMSVVLF